MNLARLARSPDARRPLARVRRMSPKAQSPKPKAQSPKSRLSERTVLWPQSIAIIQDGPGFVNPCKTIDNATARCYTGSAYKSKAGTDICICPTPKGGAGMEKMVSLSFHNGLPVCVRSQGQRQIAAPAASG
jgi:hypothetical protein